MRWGYNLFENTFASHHMDVIFEVNNPSWTFDQLINLIGEECNWK